MIGSEHPVHVANGGAEDPAPREDLGIACLIGQAGFEPALEGF